MQNMNVLKTGIRTLRNGHYEGYVMCVVGGKYMWTQNAEITRLDRDDAYNDASLLRDEIAEYNCLVKAS